ncbi:protein MpLEA-like57 [Marchantia polymorpha subsp. ruderalis]|uniref:Late embryogenesis abundant protein LEA-2 subgroup domain-containing protein n=2 Tax=Marchantia polymorpha TaxID=3197 RepID=A0AAF6BZU5_MARPO|nr:hypothetical protein MARPO_0009s0213 [Marchantia polymorpha]BBN17529.1 hypothetical protein Mp_7g15290 [Marchantia polymorpha subsp. ruderalis]|eukprot:PTQ47135.1 hypothetical protein MARPO_0009s0213 [Marchantia polymorpha]
MSKPNEDYVYGIPAYPHYVLVPVPERYRSRAPCWGVWSACRVLTAAIFLLSMVGTGFILYPKEPVMDLRRVTLEDISFHMDDGKSIIPSVTLDLSLSLLLKITNTNFFGVDYDKVVVHISYRGDELGKVQSQGGLVPARSVAMVAALLDLKGTQLMKHVSDIIVDVANNEVPIETRTVFSGVVQIMMFRPHIEVTVYCKMLVDPKSKLVLNKDCSLL